MRRNCRLRSHSEPRQSWSGLATGCRLQEPDRSITVAAQNAGLLLFLFAVAAAAQNWPSFRGPAASGVADNQKLPISWDSAKGTHILWKTHIPGLAHSSPIVWADQVFGPKAVSSRPDASFKPGL